MRLPEWEDEAAYHAAQEYFTHCMLMFRVSMGHLITFNRDRAFQYLTQAATCNPPFQ